MGTQTRRYRDQRGGRGHAHKEAQRPARWARARTHTCSSSPDNRRDRAVEPRSRNCKGLTSLGSAVRPARSCRPGEWRLDMGLSAPKASNVCACGLASSSEKLFVFFSFLCQLAYELRERSALQKHSFIKQITLSGHMKNQVRDRIGKQGGEESGPILYM
jgi:hypothetical protein